MSELAFAAKMAGMKLRCAAALAGLIAAAVALQTAAAERGQSAQDDSIAGMAGVARVSGADSSFETALRPTLSDFKGPPPTAFAFVSSQVGNTNTITRLPVRRSDKIPAGNVLGAAFTDDAIVHCPPHGRYYTTWSPWWTIADDDLRKRASKSTFSTHMLPDTATNVSLTIRLSRPTPLAKLRLTPRTAELLGFPYDFHVDVSADGECFKTIHSARDFNEEGAIPQISLDSSPVAAIRVTADRIRPEGNGFGYFQLSRVEALDGDGVNHALISKGAVAETSEPMNVPVLDRASFLDGAIVDCGVKTVLVHVNILGGSGDASLNGGFAIGTPAFDNLTDNIRYLKSRGVETYVRLGWDKSLFTAKTPEAQAAFRAAYINRITPFVKAWKGLVACYPIGNEENQYRFIGRKDPVDPPFFRQSYREAVIAVSDAIHTIDPMARTAVTSALFDFGWTEEHLKNGLAGILDEVSVHIYRETDPLGSYPEKCYSFFTDGRRGYESERLFTRAEDEIKAFRALLDKYNPKLRFASHEMSMRIGPYPRGMNSTEAGQAKFALRTYVMHHFYGISPSIWWSFNSGKISRKETGDIEWGVICSGEKRQAWYAIRNFAALFDNSWKPESEMPAVFTPADERYYSYSFKRGNRRLVACWTAVSMRDANTGRLADVFVPGEFGGNVPKVKCVDLLNGGVQTLNVERAEGGFLVRGLVMRDYPLVFCYSLPDPVKPAYRNPLLHTEVRVKDLLSQMTIDEKCAQLGKLRGFQTFDRVGGRIVVSPDTVAGMVTNCPGTVYGILRADWWSGRNWQTGVTPEMAVDAFNAYQRIAVERTRLGIPIFFVEEAPHGLMALGEPVYPTGLGLGSTFDADLTRRIGRQIGRARSRGVHCVYAPILDIALDPRWSRCEECFGEDPELVSVLGLAEFEGLREFGVEPCLKHYVGGGLAEGGHNTASAHFGLSELNNVQLRPFRRCISAGARHLMCTYHDVDGEPCTGSRFLLTDVLRGQLGFDGFVTADGGAIQLLNSRGVASSMPQAAALALKAGCDGESGSKTVAECGSLMRGAFDAGLVSMDDIDIAVGRILKLKFDMGLFEEPYATGDASDHAAEKALALEAARKSLVLLENRDALPLERGLSVAVIGPNADDKIMNQLGDYTVPQRRADVVTVLDGVKAFASRVAYAKGCGIRSKKTDGFAEAERIASEADVTVLVLGGSSSPYAGVTQSDALGGATVVTGREDDENDKDSGEGTDRSSLGYSGVQEELFRAVRAKAKKLVVVLIQGRPLVVDEIAAKADAVLLAWYPGSMGGQAVAETLYGEVNPSGRLPISIPHSVGQIPVHSGGYAANRPRYIDGPGDAAYPFGYGLSYTTFAYSGLEVSDADEASVLLTNTGSRDGDEIVRLYFSVKGSGRQRPHRELLAFRRVSLKAGETRRVTLPFDRRLFGGYGRDGAYEPPHGGVSIWVDGCKDRVALRRLAGRGKACEGI